MATCEWHEYDDDDETFCCTNPAVIRYDGRNLCAECADNGVLELLITARHARVFVATRERIKQPEGLDLYDAAIAALAPKEDV